MLELLMTGRRLCRDIWSRVIPRLVWHSQSVLLGRASTGRSAGATPTRSVAFPADQAGALLKTSFLLLAASALAFGQNGKPVPQSNPAQARPQAPAPAEDISGMYSFLKEGEFVQINIEDDGVSGYISRLGDRDSDRGTFIDQFFSKASVQGHDVAFTTKPIHGVWFEFKGRFDRGPAKTKTEDGYYVLRGTLNEFVADSEQKTTTRSRQVEFKLLGQPQDDDNSKPANRPKPRH